MASLKLFCVYIVLSFFTFRPQNDLGLVEEKEEKVPEFPLRHSPGP
jgi:hypothetical protein